MTFDGEPGTIVSDPNSETNYSFRPTNSAKPNIAITSAHLEGGKLTTTSVEEEIEGIGPQDEPPETGKKVNVKGPAEEHQILYIGAGVGIVALVLIYCLFCRSSTIHGVKEPEADDNMGVHDTYIMQEITQTNDSMESPHGTRFSNVSRATATKDGPKVQGGVYRPNVHKNSSGGRVNDAIMRGAWDALGGDDEEGVEPLPVQQNEPRATAVKKNFFGNMMAQTQTHEHHASPRQTPVRYVDSDTSSNSEETLSGIHEEDSGLQKLQSIHTKEVPLDDLLTTQDTIVSFSVDITCEEGVKNDGRNESLALRQDSMMSSESVDEDAVKQKALAEDLKAKRKAEAEKVRAEEAEKAHARLEEAERRMEETEKHMDEEGEKTGSKLSAREKASEELKKEMDIIQRMADEHPEHLSTAKKPRTQPKVQNT